MVTCAATTADGPCGAPPRTGTDRCWWHTEGLEAERAEASARGGSAPRRAGVDLSDGFRGPKSLSNLQAIAAAGEAVIGGVLAGKIGPDRARVLVAGLKLQAEVLEAIDAAKVRDEIEELRARVEEIEGSGGRVR